MCSERCGQGEGTLHGVPAQHPLFCLCLSIIPTTSEEIDDPSCLHYRHANAMAFDLGQVMSCWSLRENCLV